MVDKKPPVVTLSIVSHGDGEKVGRLLKSLEKVEVASQFQVLVTDNLGGDVADFAPAAWESIEVLRNAKPVGFGRNHNQAFLHARGTYFCVLNPDLIFHEAVFQTLLALLEEGKADVAAPLIVDSNGTPQDSYRDLPRPFELVRRRLPGYHFVPPKQNMDGTIRPDWIAGMFLLMKSDIYRRMGGFDERYYLYFEDVDLCTRARLEDLTLMVLPSVSIEHEAQRESRKSFQYLLHHVRSAARFFQSQVYKETIARL